MDIFNKRVMFEQHIQDGEFVSRKQIAKAPGGEIGNH
jgi:hypothetical protein